MKAIIGIGIPGSGKTTHLKKLAESEKFTFISSDDVREEFGYDFANRKQDRAVWVITHRRFKEAVARGGTIIDATNLKPSDRRYLIKLAREAGATRVEGYWFNVPLEVAKKRNQTRKRVVPEEVLAEMHKRLTRFLPSPDEGFDEIVEITD